MKKYRVRLRTITGDQETRDISAQNEAAAADQIRMQGGTPESVTEVSESLSLSFGKKGVPIGELYHFTRLFATLAKAGVPLLETLDLLAQRASHPGMGQVLGEIVDNVRGGSGLAAAFKMQSHVFDPTYLHMIQVGEESGELPKVLLRLTSLIQKRIELRRMIKKALTYPLLVMGVSGLVTWGILTYIVPRFKDIYARFGGDLPWLTKLTITLSDFLIRNALFTLAAIPILIFGFMMLLRTQRGRRLWDRVLLALPLVGPMFHTYEIAGFAKSFAILIHSGITVSSSLAIITPAVDRAPVRDAVAQAADAIKNGTTMSESFYAQEPWLPDLLNRMVTVGEKTGNLPEMLEHVAEYYEDEFHANVETLASLIEPMLIVFLGVVIGGIVVSLYLPIFGMAKLIAKR
ncbi:MAG TPA: type II secretion system F family protein [Candidatus Ozemobacteraceae bacterium]|nr:type II secretion system F family protein [Candidatus Ozemobacteraceae bacterium]